MNTKRCILASFMWLLSNQFFAQVAMAQSGSVEGSPNPCLIAPGQSSCLSTITWSTSGVSQPGLFWGSTLVGYGTSGNYYPDWINTGGYTFHVRAAYDNPESQVLDEVFVYGVMASGNVSANPNPCVVPSGGSACSSTVSWSSNVGSAGLFQGGQLVAAGQSGAYTANNVTTSGMVFELRTDSGSASSSVLHSAYVYGVPGQAPEQGYDLRGYLPVADNTYRYSWGSAHHRYVFFWATQDFQNLYEYYFKLSGRQGQVLIWQKIYPANPMTPENLNCTGTFGHLFIGAGQDKGVVEVGDWLNYVVNPNGTCPNNFSILGYRPGTTFVPGGGGTGLNWSGPDGLTASMNNSQTAQVFRAVGPNWEYLNYGGFGAYSSPKMIGQLLPSWSPAWARDASGNWSPRCVGRDSVPCHNKAYFNVIRMVFYHGTNQTPPAACTPNNPLSDLYYSNPPYATYATELYLDQQNGILQETLLYDLSGTFGSPCNFPASTSAENFQAALANWRWYIDK